MHQAKANKDLEQHSCIHEGLGPFSPVDVVELFQHDLDLLAIGRIHRDEMKTLSTSQVSPIALVGARSQGCAMGSTFAFFTSAGVASSKR